MKSVAKFNSTKSQKEREVHILFTLKLLFKDTFQILGSNLSPEIARTEIFFFALVTNILPLEFSKNYKLNALKEKNVLINFFLLFS